MSDDWLVLDFFEYHQMDAWNIFNASRWYERTKKFDANKFIMYFKNVLFGGGVCNQLSLTTHAIRPENDRIASLRDNHNIAIW
jgi:hypothetical protein